MTRFVSGGGGSVTSLLQAIANDRNNNMAHRRRIDSPGIVRMGRREGSPAHLLYDARQPVAGSASSIVLPESDSVPPPRRGRATLLECTRGGMQACISHRPDTRSSVVNVLLSPVLVVLPKRRSGSGPSPPNPRRGVPAHATPAAV